MYSEAMHILLDWLRYYNQAELKRFVDDESRKELWFWNKDSTADSHKAPDTMDLSWQDTSDQHFYGKNRGPASPVRLPGLLGQQQHSIILACGVKW